MTDLDEEQMQRAEALVLVCEIWPDIPVQTAKWLAEWIVTGD